MFFVDGQRASWALVVTMIYCNLIRSVIGRRPWSHCAGSIIGDQVEMKSAFRLQAIAQNGLLFASCDSEQQRYRELMEIATEMAAELGAAELSEIRALYGAAGGYATPLVDVRATVFEGERLLLLRSEVEGVWCLPGGWAHLNVSPSESAAGHLAQLLGRAVHVERVLAVWDNPSVQDSLLSYPFYGIVFQCTVVGSEDDLPGTVRFFTYSEVAELELAVGYRNRLKQLFRFQQPTCCCPEFD